MTEWLKAPSRLIDGFAPAEGPPPQTLWRFMLWSIRGALPILFLAGALSAFLGGMEVLSALLLGWIIDSALDSGPVEYFANNTWILVGALVFFVLLRPLTFGINALTNSVVIQPNIGPLVLQRLHRWTLGQAVTFFDKDFAGRIAQKQMQSSAAMTDIVSETINTLFFAIASIVAAGLMLGAINPWVGVSLGVWLVAYIGLISWYMPRIRALAKARANARSAVTGQIVDSITNIKTVKLFAHATHEDKEALKAMSEFRGRVINFGALAATFRLFLMTLAGLLPVMLIGGTLYLWSHGIATAGDIAAAGAISIRIAQMTGWVSFTLMTIYANIGEVEDGMRTLSPAWTLTDAPDAQEVPPSDGLVEFDNVSFAYGRGPGSGGISGVSLTLKPGEKVGLVGASGAGKSTLVSLLLRLYDVEDGAVRIDGRDVRQLQQEGLRRQIGMVTQETAMFNRTARDNLMYGRPDATEEEMIAAARRAEAHDFIVDLKDFHGRRGYDAFLGERGVRLSGGQRQRIALARAILKDAPILVLDEATSALDSEVEAQIQSALERVMEGKTVLAIAHRLSTIARMDRIIVLDQGQIAEQGTHEELLQLGGHYARFWDKQSGGFLGLRDAAE